MTMRFGRYQTLRSIASGGMATVYLARVVGEGGFQRLVALKVMHPHLAQDPEFVSMFLDEARLAAGIRHPNVVGVLDIDRDSDGLFIVMEYVDGLTLREAILSHRKQDEPIPLPVLLRVFLDTLAGLHAAHELSGPDGEPLNLVHRDVSPSNMLLGRDGLCRITDFGVARAEARIATTHGGELKGKIPYMSPEQLSGQMVDRRTDVYAAGCMMWEMFTLHRLFRAADQGSLIGAVLSGPKQSPAEASEHHVPDHLDRACMRALLPIGDRFASAHEFAMAVDEAAREDGVAIAARSEVGEYVDSLAPPVPVASGPGVDQVGQQSGSMPQPLISSSASASIRTGADANAAPAAAGSQSYPRTDATLVRSPDETRPARRNTATILLVAALASLLGAAAVWLTTRDGAAPPATAASASAPSTVVDDWDPAEDRNAPGPMSSTRSKDVASAASADAGGSTAAARSKPWVRPWRPKPVATPTRKPKTGDGYRPKRP